MQDPETLLQKAVKDHQTVMPDGTVLMELIDGVQCHETKNIITGNGMTTEIFREDWALHGLAIQHMIHVSFRPRGLSAWHLHTRQTDHVFCTAGSLRVVLFDDRPGSPTRGRLNVFHLSRMRPTLLVLPPHIWHGIQNLEAAESSFINFFDQQFCYEDPDDWRLPQDTDAIPYRFVP